MQETVKIAQPSEPDTVLLRLVHIIIVINLKMKLIGKVIIDSGIISVLDHTHLNVNESGRINLPSYNLYTAIDTEIGDGEFKVYEKRDRKGKLKKIIIDIDNG